jgi:tripeptide aminopeptidase
LHERFCDAHEPLPTAGFNRNSTKFQQNREVSQPVLDLFTELAAVPSPPGEERAVADAVSRYLRDLALEPEEDDTGPAVGSTCGNVLSRLEPQGTDGAGVPLFLCAHLDTVPPEGPVEPAVEDGVVRNAAGTILGADNKAAVAVMLEAARRVLSEGRPHAGIELLFTPKEEVGLLGAFAFDHTRLRASVGYVYDQAAPIGEVIVGAPHAHSMRVRFHGRAAHAGMYPEEGRSAVAAAARAIADFRLGRLDEETTANVGTIQGGTATNIVPEWCSFVGEARSHDERKLADTVQEMLDAVAFAATVGECEVETEVKKSYRGYRFRRDDWAVSLAAQALSQAGYEPTYALSGGGADANVFNERGLACVNLANGMAQIHTSDEHIAVADLEGMVEVTLALIDAARLSDDAQGGAT